jgi:cation transport ATPase
MAYELGAVDHDTTPLGRWLRLHRLRAALWIAVLEAVLAAFTHDVSRWTIVALAAIFVPIYLLWGRHRRNDVLRQLSWIAAASQALAVIAAVMASVIGLFALILAAVFAGVALLLIFADRR